MSLRGKDQFRMVTGPASSRRKWLPESSQMVRHYLACGKALRSSSTLSFLPDWFHVINQVKPFWKLSKGRQFCATQVSLKACKWSAAYHSTRQRGFTCEHALDRLLCQALGILEFLHCHSAGELHIGVNDGGPDISRAVALYPAMLCEVEAVQLYPKELHPTGVFAVINILSCLTSPLTVAAEMRQLIIACQMWLQLS